MNWSAPDCLSASRIALALVLFLTEPLSWQFLIIYAAAGTTDILDGRLARMTGKTTRHGPYLDSTADIALAISVLAILIPYLDLETWMLVWIAAIAVVRVTGFAAGSLRYRRPAFVHTNMSKLTGAGLGLSPFLIIIIGIVPTVLLVGAVATVSSLEYLYINLRSDGYDPDCASAISRRPL
ncbi:CDP-alcohol phosphatidyltransferase [Thermoplasmatales archaeon BRNA1]|nr:CDP-alcohol phosphatidyltransferase [Thermoplasmatales archaeon BRNA1]